MTFTSRHVAACAVGLWLALPAFDDSCGLHQSACEGNTAAEGLGPAIALWLREVDAAGDAMPGREARSRLYGDG